MLAGCSGTRVLDTSLSALDEPEEPVELYHWPLTGRAAPDEEIIGRRPISLKIDNFVDARPQRGLIDADIVYEIVVEGDMTRFHAIYQSILPELAGPMRSARETDAWVVPQWGSYLFYSGSTEEVRYALESAGLDLLTEGTDPRIWERVDWRVAPHNLYVHIANAPALVGEFGIDTAHWQPRTLDFAEDRAPEAIDEVHSITIPFGGVTATWEWDSASSTFLRSQDGAPHVDEVTGRQIQAANVVVLWADYYLFEHGLVSMFQQGRRIDGNWSSQPDRPPALSTVNGAPISYQVGNTWFELVIDGTQIVVE
jgi:hypothetical protein